MARSLKYPHIPEFRVGDRITIHENPICWSSLCNNNKGTLSVAYPYSLVITNVKYDSGGWCFTEGKFGWYYEDGYPMTKEETLMKSSVLIEYGSVVKADPILLSKRQVSLVYKQDIKKDTSKVESTYNSEQPKEEDGQSLRDLVKNANNIVDDSFSGLLNEIPEQLRMYYGDLRKEYFNSGELVDTKLDCGKSIRILKGSRLVGYLGDILYDHDEYYLGGYSYEIVSKIIKMSKELYNTLYENSPEAIGELITSVPNWNIKLACQLIIESRQSINILVSETFDYDYLNAVQFRFDDIDYFAWIED